MVLNNRGGRSTQPVGGGNRHIENLSGPAESRSLPRIWLAFWIVDCRSEQTGYGGSNICGALSCTVRTICSNSAYAGYRQRTPRSFCVCALVAAWQLCRSRIGACYGAPETRRYSQCKHADGAPPRGYLDSCLPPLLRRPWINLRIQLMKSYAGCLMDLPTVLREDYAPLFHI